jgi:hypothetical protein
MESEKPLSGQLGSSSWLGAEEYDAGDKLHERSTKFFASVKCDVLVAQASRIRDDVPYFKEKFSIGYFNMVGHVAFEGGAYWIARLRLPELQNIFGTREALDPLEMLRMEIASMKIMKYVPGSNGDTETMTDHC